MITHPYCHGNGYRSGPERDCPQEVSREWSSLKRQGLEGVRGQLVISPQTLSKLLDAHGGACEELRVCVTKVGGKPVKSELIAIEYVLQIADNWQGLRKILISEIKHFRLT